MSPVRRFKLRTEDIISRTRGALALYPGVSAGKVVKATSHRETAGKVHLRQAAHFQNETKQQEQ